MGPPIFRQLNCICFVDIRTSQRGNRGVSCSNNMMTGKVTGSFGEEECKNVGNFYVLLRMRLALLSVGNRSSLMRTRHNHSLKAERASYRPLSPIRNSDRIHLSDANPACDSGKSPILWAPAIYRPGTGSIPGRLPPIESHPSFGPSSLPQKTHYCAHCPSSFWTHNPTRDFIKKVAFLRDSHHPLVSPSSDFQNSVKLLK